MDWKGAYGIVRRVCIKKTYFYVVANSCHVIPLSLISFRAFLFLLLLLLSFRQRCRFGKRQMDRPIGGLEAYWGAC